MIVRGVKLRAVTEAGEFGFDFQFSRNLTVIRAKNSSGKSTLFNSLLYGLGMEELIGGRGNKVLPYAVKDYFEYGGSRHTISASEVLLELENSEGHVITTRRIIHDSEKDSKLVEVFDCAHLTAGQPLTFAQPKYVHDAGGAQKDEGFHRYLEKYLGLNLPRVSTTSGGEAKLYLQTVFAALAVEQKRGWTDYIANIPFFGIKDARLRVVEFLLGLSVFETNATRARLNAESVEIDAAWRRIVSDFRSNAANNGVEVSGVPAAPSAKFEKEKVGLYHLFQGVPIPLSDYMSQLRVEYSKLGTRVEHVTQHSGEQAVQEIEMATADLQRLAVIYDTAISALGGQRVSLREYESLLGQATEDLERNKTAAKLRTLGAQYEISLSSDKCPTCNQTVEDTLLAEAVTGPQMDLATNISYLESQVRMLSRQIAGLKDGIHTGEARVAELSKRLADKRDQVVAMRGDVTSGAQESKAIVRRQVKIEVEVEALDKLLTESVGVLDSLQSIALRLASNQKAREKLPKNAYTEDDELRVGVFEKQFRANVGSFGYESAKVSDIELSRDNLIPSLAQLELREIRTDIKSDSSASDFVRLIWSYLLGLYQTSNLPQTKGNHPGLMMFDEPGQHSMAVGSQHALLQQLASENGLQSIVAASFDESEEVFLQATAGVPHKLIEWEGKLVRPLQ